MNVEKIVSTKPVGVDSKPAESARGKSQVMVGVPDSWVCAANETQERRQWTIKGIPPSAVDQTREAARRSGMKLNAWVTQALYNAVESVQMDNDPDTSAPQSDEQRMENLEGYIKESLEDLRRRTEEIENSMKTINAFLVRMYTERR